MALVKTEDLRKTPTQSFAARYLGKVFNMGKDKKSFGEIGQEFLYWCQFGRQSPIAKTTLSTYTKSLELIAKHFGDVPVSDVSMDHILNLKKDFIDRGSSIGYLHKILMITRLILKYASEELQMEVLPFQRIKLPTKPRAEVKFWSESELNRILDCIPSTTIQGIRLKAIMTTILDTGMRISEVMNLNRDSIDWGDKSAFIIGKGSKERKVLFQDWSLWWIKQYLNQRRDDHVAMFVTHQNGYPLERLQPDDVRRVFRQIGKKTGILTRPHIGRKTAGTRMWHNGADIQDVQIFLGHEKIQTTQIYVGKNYQRVQQVQERTLVYGGAGDTGRIAVVKWSKDHDKCLHCGLTENRHAAKGFCYNCYMNLKNARKRAELVQTVAKLAGIST